MSQNLILIVEDDESILFNLKLSLEMNDFGVITASNGIEALSALESMERLPDLILSDIMMPEMNGYELLESISKDEKLNHIPVIFVSARSSPDDIRTGKDLGIHDYITKPIREEVLLTIIKKNLQNIKV